MNNNPIQYQAANQMAQTAPGSFYIQTTPEAEDLKRFLATAPQLWTKPDDPPIRSYQLSSGESISCIFWRGKFFITGTDIVKILIFRFSQAGRPVLNAKKFEEGIFSDLRNLKSGTEAILEEPKSEFLEFLFRHGCIRTQKKQKVFFWNCVPHESLFLDAIERDFKREGSLYHMNMMMNHTRYLQKQVAMMQANAIQQQFTGNSVGSDSPSATMIMPPAPQMMPNNSRSSSISNGVGANNINNGNLYPQPGQFSQTSSNTIDPFLMNAPLRLSNGKINLNAPISVPTPQKAPISQLSQSNQLQLSDSTLPESFAPFDFNAYESNVNFNGEDPLLAEYFSHAGQDNSGYFIDPSTMMNLHEY